MIDSDESNGGIGLAMLRELLGDISQQELANRIGASISTIYRGEAGERVRLDLDQIKALEVQLHSVGLTFQSLDSDLSKKG